jgi:transposase-like protein
MKEVSSMATKGKTETPKTETKAEPVEVRTVKVAEDGTKKYKCQYCGKVAEDGTKKYKCQYCGKWIKADTWEEAMAGDYCHQLREERGFDDASLAKHRANMSADDVPESKDGRPYVKVAVLNKICRREGIPVSRMVNGEGIWWRPFN